MKSEETILNVNTCFIYIYKYRKWFRKLRLITSETDCYDVSWCFIHMEKTSARWTSSTTANMYDSAVITWLHGLFYEIDWNRRSFSSNGQNPSSYSCGLVTQPESFTLLRASHWVSYPLLPELSSVYVSKLIISQKSYTEIKASW